MKKIAIAALALVAISLAGVLPYFFGLKTEQVFRSRLAEASTRGQVRYEVQNYERGYLVSKVDVLIVLDFLGEVANAEPETQKLTRLLFQGTVHHGPLILSAGSFEGEPAPLFALGAMDGALFFEQEPVFYQMFFGQAPLVTSRAVIGPTGAADLKIRGQRLAYKAPDGSIDLDWKGFLASVSLDGDRLGGKVEGEGLTASSRIGGFNLLGYRSGFDLVRHSTGYYLGRQNMTMDGVNVSVGDQKIFSAGKLTVGYDSSADTNLMSFSSTLDFSKFEVGKRTFGPMTLKTLGRNIDLNGVKMLEQSYRDALTNLETGRKANSENAPPPGSDPGVKGGLPTEPSGGIQLSDDIVAALKTIAGGAPSIEVPGFSLDSPDGRVTGTVKMGVSPTAKIDFSNPESITAAVFMDFSISVPRKLAVEFWKLNMGADVRKRLLMKDAQTFPTEAEVDDYAGKLAEKKLDEKIKQGLYRPRGEYLLMDGGLGNGILTVNGKRIPL